MRLVDLEPRWLLKDGARIGFLFRSPVDPKWHQSCFFTALPWREQEEAVERLGGEELVEAVQYCKSGCNWTRTPAPAQATFDNMSIVPSLDGSAGGLWHGFITNGEIVGGLP